MNLFSCPPVRGLFCEKTYSACSIQTCITNLALRAGFSSAPDHAQSSLTYHTRLQIELSLYNRIRGAPERCEYRHFLDKKCPNCDLNVTKKYPNIRHLSKLWPKSVQTLDTCPKCDQNIWTLAQIVNKKWPSFGHLSKIWPKSLDTCPKCDQKV